MIDVDRSSRGRPSGSLVAYLHRVFRIAGALLATVVAVNAGLFAYLLWELGPELRETIDDARTVRQIHEAMLDQETGLRGFF